MVDYLDRQASASIHAFRVPPPELHEIDAMFNANVVWALIERARDEHENLVNEAEEKRDYLASCVEVLEGQLSNIYDELNTYISTEDSRDFKVLLDAIREAVRDGKEG